MPIISPSRVQCGAKPNYLVHNVITLKVLPKLKTSLLPEGKNPEIGIELQRDRETDDESVTPVEDRETAIESFSPESLMRVGSPSTLKKRRLTTIDPMEIESAKERLEAAKQKFGREIRVFETSAASPVINDASSSEVSDDFYEFTTEDYYRILSTKKEDKFLKTKKIREREEAARRSKITKAVIRVRFPDNYTLEATFHPSEKIQSLFDLLNKVVAQPELPFYIYTTPPKKQVKDMSQDFFAAGFVPGAIVYFSYDLPKGVDGVSVSSGPFLHEDVLSLNGLEYVPEPVEAAEPAPQHVTAASPSQVAPERKPTGKKTAKPKWLKL